MPLPLASAVHNLRNGIADGDLADGAMLVGQVGDEQVLLARRGREVFAIGAALFRYTGPWVRPLAAVRAQVGRLSNAGVSRRR